ncbi:MAG TPA: pantetheine-phosphate adenylyltransferase [Mycobacteriales bacterium]|nr:pantetheine-phosphate adenylyltransferase [Mycobacteriales bacterium]
MRRAVCPGSFDPVTNGHLDIFTRAAALYDEVVVAVGTNSSKNRLFSVEERLDMLRAVTSHLPQIRVTGFSGLLVDFCRTNDIPVIIKGVRGTADVDYEVQMAQMNRQLADVETLFVPTDNRYSFLSSSLVREVATFGGDVSALVPPYVADRLTTRLTQSSAQQDGE